MAQQKAWLGKVGPFIYDDVSGDVYTEDGVPITGLRLTGQGRVETAPTEDTHILRLVDLLPLLFKKLVVLVANINDPSPELSLLGASHAGIIIAVGANIWYDEATLYIYDPGGGAFITQNSPYAITASDGGGWVAMAGKYHYGSGGVLGDMFPAVDDSYSLGSSALRYLAGYFVSAYADAVPTLGNQLCNKDYVDSVVGGGGTAQVQFVSVANIANPAAELAALDNTNGNLLVAYQSVASTNDKETVYRWDSSASTTNSPYVVAGSGGKWIAIGGCYCNPALTVQGALTTNGALTAVGNAAIGGGLTVYGITTLLATYLSDLHCDGLIICSINPCVGAQLAALQSINNATDTLIAWTEETDRGTNFDSNTFTVPTNGDGIYEISVGVYGTCSAAGYAANIKIFKNGVEISPNFVGITSAANFAANGTYQFPLVATNAITIKFRQNTGGTASLTSAYLSIRKVA